jgi:hypothetical protein
MGIGAEWSMLEAERTARALSGRAKIEALRLAAEYRRQWLLANRDLDRTIPKPPPAGKPKPGPAQLTLERHLELLQRP